MCRQIRTGLVWVGNGEKLKETSRSTIGNNNARVAQRIWEQLHLPKDMCFCSSSPEIYTAATQLVTSLFSTVVKQNSLVTSPPPVCNWTVIEQQQTEEIIPLALITCTLQHTLLDLIDAPPSPSLQG